MRVRNQATISSGGGLLVTNSTLRIEGGALTVNAVTDNASLTVRTNGTVAVVGPVTVGGGVNSTGLVIVTGGQLVVTNNPALVGAGSGFIMDGSVTLTNGSSIIVSNVTTIVGNRGSGSLTVMGGSMLVTNVIVGELSGSGGTLTVSGGILTAAGTLTVADSINATGTVWLTGGDIVVTSSIARIVLGRTGTAQMTVSNGNVQCTSIEVGTWSPGAGTLSVHGGTLSVSNIFAGGLQANGTGTVWMTGGVVTNFFTSLGESFSVGRMTISNGTWQTRRADLGRNPGGQGTLTVVGGTNSVFDSMTLGLFDCTASGTVVVAGGQLFVTNSAASAVLEVRSGSLILNAGLLTINKFVMTNACGSFVRTGGTLVYGTAVLDPALDADGDGLPNGWEQSFGLDPLDPFGNNGAAGDPDGDGLTNLQEFQGGTDPTDNPAFRIVSIVREINNVRVAWMMVVDKTNALQATAGGASGSYSTNGFADIFTVTNAVGSVTNYLDIGAATNAPSLYYRVRLVP